MEKEILQAARILERGGVVCFPTETVYALAANAYDADACQRIYEIKGRDYQKPLAILAPTIESLQEIAVTNDIFNKIAKELSPGPITYILPKKGSFDLAVNANLGLSSVAVRIPDHAIALAILKEANCPVVATSANISGESDSIDEAQVNSVFSEMVDLVVAGGKSKIGVASTIVDLCSGTYEILREGVVTKEMIENAIGG